MRVLISCVRMHRQADKSLSGNFYLCLHLFDAMERNGNVDFLVHADAYTAPRLRKVLPPDRLCVEDRPVESIRQMELLTRRAIAAVKPDLFHKPTGQLPLLPLACRTIWGVSDLNYRYLPTKLLQKAYKHISYRSSARRADHIVAISDATRCEIIRTLPAAPEKVTTIHLGTTAFGVVPQPMPELMKEQFVVTFGHHRHKNVEASLEVLARCRRQGIQLNLAVVGDVNFQNELDPLIEKLGVTSNVKFTGRVTEGQLRFLYENAVCLLFLSHHEGFGLPILESQAASCPVISSNVFSLPEVVGASAPTFACDDYGGVELDLMKLLRDSEYRTSRIAAGHRNTQRFSWEKAAKETFEIYFKVQ